MNYIKYQIYLKFSQYLKKLLFLTFEFTNINSLQKRTKQTVKAILHHFYLCNHSNTHICSMIFEDEEHDFSTISKKIFKKSYDQFLASSNMEIDGESKLPIIQLTLDFTIFGKDQKYQASFDISTPISTINELANNTEKQYMNLNSVETNPKR